MTCKNKAVPFEAYPGAYKHRGVLEPPTPGGQTGTAHRTAKEDKGSVVRAPCRAVTAQPAMGPALAPRDAEGQPSRVCAQPGGTHGGRELSHPSGSSLHGGGVTGAGSRAPCCSWGEPGRWRPPAPSTDMWEHCNG